jgi:hypothetical protein
VVLPQYRREHRDLKIRGAPSGGNFSLKGYQIVAGGRSVAQITGWKLRSGAHPGGVPLFFLTPVPGVEYLDYCPVVYAPLRPPATI